MPPVMKKTFFLVILGTFAYALVRYYVFNNVEPGPHSGFSHEQDRLGRRGTLSFAAPVRAF